MFTPKAGTLGGARRRGGGGGAKCFQLSRKNLLPIIYIYIYVYYIIYFR